MIELTLGILLLILLGLGLIEAHYHKLALAQLPIRIHVNGSRGKSSVTRLIASGLRAGGLKTLAKTTGTAPRILMKMERIVLFTVYVQHQLENKYDYCVILPRRSLMLWLSNVWL